MMTMRECFGSFVQLGAPKPDLQLNLQLASAASSSGFSSRQHSQVHNRLQGGQPVVTQPLPGTSALVSDPAALGKTAGAAVEHCMPPCPNTHRVSFVVTLAAMDPLAVRRPRDPSEPVWQDSFTAQQQQSVSADDISAMLLKVKARLPAGIDEKVG